MGVVTTHDADAAHLVELYDAMWRIHHVNARRADESTLTGAHIGAALKAGDVLDEACEEFRRRFYPRRARVFVGLRQVMTAGASNRGVRVVFDPERVAA